MSIRIQNVHHTHAIIALEKATPEIIPS